METRIIGDHSSIMESLLRDSFLSFPLINPISLLFSQPNSHSTSFCLSSLPLNAQSRIEEANFPDKPRSFRKSLLLLSLFFLRHSRPSKFSHSFFVTSFATKNKEKSPFATRILLFIHFFVHSRPKHLFAVSLFFSPTTCQFCSKRELQQKANLVHIL